ncbi:MAG: hypothetical protein R3A78_06740 [Polyangiales bacterium]
MDTPTPTHQARTSAVQTLRRRIECERREGTRALRELADALDLAQGVVHEPPADVAEAFEAWCAESLGLDACAVSPPTPIARVVPAPTQFALRA